MPLWHSFVTGIYAKNRQEFRIWLPGGTASECINNALAVPTGTPFGSEEERGLSLENFTDESDDPMNL